MVVKIIQNEFKKFFAGKTFVFEVLLMIGLFSVGVIAYRDMANIVAENLPRAHEYTEDFKNVLMNMDGVAFAKLSLTDFVYKNNLPFFLIFIVIHTVNAFSSDRENGTMKFTLLTGVDNGTLMTGKLVFIACSIGVIVLLNIFLSLVIGFFSFGGTGSLIPIAEYIGISLLAIIPGFAMAVIIAVLSQIRISSKIIMAIGLIAVLVMGMLDTMTATNRFSPIGALSIFSEQMPSLSQALLTRCLVSLVYCVVGFFLLNVISKEYEFYE